MKLFPLNDHILLEPEIIDENAFNNAKKTESGLWVAKSKEEAKALRSRCDKGKVIQTGDTVVKVKIGDQVLLYPYAHTDFEWEGKKLSIAKEEDILLVLRDE